MTTRGRFVVIDGVEGCGKSTQCRLLAEALRERGIEVVITHEPGGTEFGEAIRHLLLDPQYTGVSSLTELFLFCASRAQHVAEVIEPALAAGKTVVCDRFGASTAVYQGFAGGLGFALVEQLNEIATGGVFPDLTIVLDLDPEVGMRRKFAGDKMQADRIERKAIEYHHKVREGYLQYAHRHRDRVRIIGADASPDDIHREIRALVL
jgi:dTMP kinase